MKAKRNYVAIVVAAVIACIITFCATKPRNQYVSLGGALWHTEYHISFYGNPNLRDSVLPVLSKVEQSVSMFNPSSVISAINDNSSTTVDSIFSELYHISRYVYQQTDGAFDPTVTPLMIQWGFVEDTGVCPSQYEIDSVLQFVGLDKTSLSGNKFSKQDPRTQLDFSSFAKGYGCDMVGRMLERNGVENYIIELGGDIAAKGHNSENKPWTVAIDKPEMQKDTVVHKSIHTIEITSGGIATSGNYRNYKQVGNRIVSHIINPHTGYSTESDMLSATVIAPNCTLADAFATAFMVLGFEKSKQIALSHPELKVFFIYSDSAGDIQHFSTESKQ